MDLCRNERVLTSANTYLFIPLVLFMIKNCYKLTKIGIQKKWVRFFLLETL